MKQVPKWRIQEIMSRIDCPEGFECYKSGFENLCPQEITECDGPDDCRKAQRDQGNDTPCALKTSSGRDYCCRCPLRIYVATYLNNITALEGPISGLRASAKQADDSGA